MKDLLEGLSAVEAAKRLLGSEFVREFSDGSVARVRIVETEAYDQTDAASHSFNGRTQRVDVMFRSAGHLYVYFTYGMHYCMNVVVGAEGYGAAVLIRSVEPLSGEQYLQEHRNKSGFDLTNGPAKLCQALAIDKHLNGHDLAAKPLQLEMRSPLLSHHIITTPRIGISKAVSVPWRFYVKGSGYISHAGGTMKRDELS